MIDSKAVKKVAHLARLSLSEEEIPKLAGEMSSILEYVEKLNDLDLTNVEPMSHAVSLDNVFREDNVKSSTVIDDVLTQAPQASAPFFRVPKVL